MRVLVTGASGFVGRAVCERLVAQGVTVRAAVRRPANLSGRVEVVTISDIDGSTDWRAALAGVDAVVHLASRVHMIGETSADVYPLYRRTNVEGTERLARAAAAANVRTFVFVSSIKVNGEETTSRAYSETDPPNPQDAYGRSKSEAEIALQQVVTESAMHVTVLRPPLVYGPGVRANFLRLMRLVATGMPLPLRSVSNRRSMIYVHNLADAIAVAVSRPAAERYRTFLLSDGEDLSTPDLIRRLAAALRKRAILLPVPPRLLELAAGAAGAGEAARRLTGSLQVDSRAFRAAFGWTPPYSTDAALAETVRWFRSEGK